MIIMSKVCPNFVWQQSFQVANGKKEVLEFIRNMSRDFRVLNDRRNEKNWTQIRQKLDSERTFFGQEDIFWIKPGHYLDEDKL